MGVTAVGEEESVEHVLVHSRVQLDLRDILRSGSEIEGGKFVKFMAKLIKRI